MRNFQNIVDKIIKIIDEECDFDEERVSNIIQKIDKIKRDNGYKAPELQYESWCELSELLSDNFNPNNSLWEKKIQIIFNDLKEEGK